MAAHDQHRCPSSRSYVRGAPATLVVHVHVGDILTFDGWSARHGRAQRCSGRIVKVHDASAPAVDTGPVEVTFIGEADQRSPFGNVAWWGPVGPRTSLVVRGANGNHESHPRGQGWDRFVFHPGAIDAANYESELDARVGRATAGLVMLQASTARAIQTHYGQQ